MKPSPARVRSLIEYNPKTGLLRWKGPTRTTRPRGWFKGSKSVRNYWRVYIDGRNYLVHVIAYVIMKGRWPRPGVEIKHRNRADSDNRWSNIRPASHAQVTYNRKRNKNNTTGFRGVSKFGDRFRGVLIVRRARVELGLFDRPDDAGSVWAKAARRYYEGHYEQ